MQIYSYFISSMIRSTFQSGFLFAMIKWQIVVVVVIIEKEHACRNLCKSKFIYLFKPDIYLQYLWMHNMTLLIIAVITFIEEMREGISIKNSRLWILCLWLTENELLLLAINICYMLYILYECVWRKIQIHNCCWFRNIFYTECFSFTLCLLMYSILSGLEYTYRKKWQHKASSSPTAAKEDLLCLFSSSFKSTIF
jgi:hypothetical protein